MTTLGNTRLAVLAQAADEVAATSSRKSKSERLGALLKDLTPDEIAPAIGFLTANPVQGAIGVGWASVAKTMKSLDRDRDADRATEAEGEPTVLDFDRLLTQLKATRGSGSEQLKLDLLAGFLRRCPPSTRSFVGRVLVGEARLGALAGVMVEAVAKASGVKATSVRRALMLQGDLGRTARVALTEGAEAIEAIDLEVGRPILPMLASTAAGTAEAIEDLGEAIVEWKLDGARIQVHLDRDAGEDRRLLIVTRNLNDVTDRLPWIRRTVEQLACRSAVLDGEVLGVGADGDQADLDGAGDGPDAFQDTISRFSRQPTGDPQADGDPLRAWFFDLMYLDGESLIDRPLAERSVLLRRLAGDHCVPSITTDDPARAATHLEQALAAGHEGVMIKATGSRYEAGRRGKSWRKVKPVHTLDLVILAAEWGYGRRTGKLSNLHLGARDPEGGFVMVGKTFKGLTDDTLAWQTENFPLHADDDRSTPSTVALKPHFVAEIAVDGAQRSTRYPGGVALRFARLRRYRSDKNPAEADTIQAVQALLAGSTTTEQDPTE